MGKKLSRLILVLAIVANSVLIIIPEKAEASSGYTLSVTAPAIHSVSQYGGFPNPPWGTFNQDIVYTISPAYDGGLTQLSVVEMVRPIGTAEWDTVSWGSLQAGQTTIIGYPTFPQFHCYELRGQFSWYEGGTRVYGETSNIVSFCLHDTVTGATSTMGTTPATPTTPTTPTTPSTPTVSYAPIASVTLPSLFDGTTSTYAELTLEQATAYSGLTIERSQFGKIIFNDPVDLSSEEVAQIFAALDQHIDIQNGSVSIGAGEVISQFAGKSVQVSLYNIELDDDSEELTVKVNGEEVKIEEYNYENKTLQFNLTLSSDAATKIEYLPKAEVTSTETSSDTAEEKTAEKEKLSSNALIAIGIGSAALVAAGTAGTIVLWKKGLLKLPRKK